VALGLTRVNWNEREQVWHLVAAKAYTTFKLFEAGTSDISNAGFAAGIREEPSAGETSGPYSNRFVGAPIVYKTV
jgi:hypothetical protein